MKPTWNLRDALEDLLGRRQQHLITELRGQLDAGRDAVEVALTAVRGELAPAAARARLDELETVGDRHRAALVTTLATTFVIPIDREDLFRFSRTTDDVLENLQDFCHELELYGIEVLSPLFVPLLEPVGEGLDALVDAVEGLSEGTATVDAGYRRAKRCHNTIRSAYQHAIADLFVDDPTSTTLKQRELLRRLDVVGLRLCEAADALADGHLKRGG